MASGLVSVSRVLHLFHVLSVFHVFMLCFYTVVDVQQFNSVVFKCAIEIKWIGLDR